MVKLFDLIVPAFVTFCANADFPPFSAKNVREGQKKCQCD